MLLLVFSPQFLGEFAGFPPPNPAQVLAEKGTNQNIPSWVSASVAALQRPSLSAGILFAMESISLNLSLLPFQEESFEIPTGSACRVALCELPLSLLFLLHTSAVPDADQAVPPLGQAEELPGSQAKRTPTRAHGSPVEFLSMKNGKNGIQGALEIKQ